MIALLLFFLAALASPFRSKSRLEAENAALRHQLIVLRRKMQGASDFNILSIFPPPPLPPAFAATGVGSRAQ